MKTNRCTIEKIKLADYDEIKPLFFDEKVRKYLGGAIQEERYDDTFKDMLNIEDDSFYWSVRLTDSNELIGLVSIDDHHDGEYKELSYQFVPDVWGKGYAYEVTRYILRYAADKFDIKNIVSETQVANRASCGLLNKLGMKVMKKVYRFNAEQYIFLWEAE